MLYIVAVAFYEVAFLVHALSHFLAARGAGITVSTLAIGFGPRILRLAGTNTTYTFNLIPLGAYTVIDFTSGPALRKRPGLSSLLVVAAGSLGNFALAAALLTTFAMTVGLVTSFSNQIGTVVPDSPAAQAGLRPGDKILMIDGVPMKDGETLLRTIHMSGGRTLTLLLERDGAQLLFRVPTRYDARQRVWLIGFTPAGIRHHDLVRAVSWGIATTVSSIGAYLGILVTLFQGRAPDVVTEPTAMAALLGQGPRVTGALATMAIFSIFTGLLNLLPIPPLDGGRAIQIIYGWLRQTHQ